jgi:hypothetical protein
MNHDNAAGDANPQISLECYLCPLVDEAYGRIHSSIMLLELNMYLSNPLCITKVFFVCGLWSGYLFPQ